MKQEPIQRITDNDGTASRRVRLRTVSQKMIADLGWLTGERLVEVVKRDHSWAFIFSGGGCIATEQAWRLVTNEGVAVASEDHGQPFGLLTPVDASARVLSASKEQQVSAVRVVDQTGDLSVFFGSATRVEFLTLSCGYEGWRVTHGSSELICLGGGALHRNEKPG